ncbi:lysozyme [Pseudoblastomonas halimionae]|uniref:Lysozyme n=1 Tax=Alteriqipengyuania halimionae TaxID=1926630 RepID=A0A6I4U363_9SPHN|nr:lysozyme [Alteriqipengyuania halimionae]MXP10156.1 glycoside hydrolase family protein [Alteriqipengyuania halimionae]
MNRQPIFDTVRDLIGRGFMQAEVDRIDHAIDLATGGIAANAPHPMKRATSVPKAFRLGPRGKALIRKWEGCHKRRADGRYDAYPDPGSADGHPWTIGWGSTGPGIAKGTVWTRAQCDARFDADLQRYAAEVERALEGAPTTQAQFDALVSFHYNTGAIFRATLTKKHRAGDHAGATREFARWIYNDRRPLAGLVRRRREEAALFSSGSS